MPRNSANNGKEAERSREKMKDKTKDKNIKEATEQPMEVQEPASSTFTSNNKTIDADRKSSRPTDELKLLQDSLSQFFTPSAGRRCRQPPRKFEEVNLNNDENEKDKDSGNVADATEKSIERNALSSNNEDAPEVMEPLSVDTAENFKPGLEALTSNSSARSSDISPSRRICEKLVDSLSPYFSASLEKRRTMQKGEFAQLNSGRLRPPGDHSPSHSSVHCCSSVRELSRLEDEELGSSSINKAMFSRRRLQKSDQELKPVVGGRNTQNSASAALFSWPSHDDRGRSNSGSRSPPQKRVRTPKIPHTPTASPKKIKDSADLKKERQGDNDHDTEDTTAQMIDLKEAGVTRRQVKDNKGRRSMKLTSLSVTSPCGSGIGEKENMGTDELVEDGQIHVSEENQQLFGFVQLKTQESIEKAIRELATSVCPDDTMKEPRWPLAIRIGKFEVSTWYSAPYPQEYAHVPVLHICEYCLKYMKTEAVLYQHKRKCEWRHPPGNEIYRDGNVSVFEVDGNISRIYCQNLCLIAKLFLDHKTLYYDVEPFLFYVVTKNDDMGFHFVGYFSKEKYSAQKFNLSCIVTLPCYQKQGFGRFLIDLSFLISRRENMLGTPERPLSDLGRISYASYWRTALFEWIHENIPKNGSKKVTLMDVAKGTGISIYDIVEVFEALQWFQKVNGSIVLEFNWTMIDIHWKKCKSDKSRIWLNETCLKWSPSIYTPSKDFGIRSPVMSPTPKRNQLNNGNVSSTPNGVSLAAVGSTIKKGAAVLKSSKKSACSRRLKLEGTLITRKQKEYKITTTTTDDDTSSGEDEKDNKISRKGCKDPPVSKRGRRDDSPHDDEDIGKGSKKGRRGCSYSSRMSSALRKKQPTVTVASNGKKGIMGRNTRRGKAVFEELDISSDCSRSTSDDDLDESFHIGKGRKPQKGKVLLTHKKRRPVPRKALGKSPGKVFPGNYSGRTITPSKKDIPPLLCDSPTTSVGTAATIPMRMEESRVNTPGGGRSLQDVEGDDEVTAISSSPAVDRGPPPSPSHSSLNQQPSTSRLNRVESQTERKSTTASSAESSEHSDIEESRPPSDSSHCASSFSSRADTPQPLGDRIPDHEDVVNMGGVPDEDEGFSRCAPSEESDLPPQLQAEAVAELITHPGSSSDVPCLHGPRPSNAPSQMQELQDDYNTDDDDAPPQLSPANIVELVLSEPKDESQMTEEEKKQLAMDRPPKAPAMLDKVNEEDREMLFPTISLSTQSMSSHEHHQGASVSAQAQVTTTLQQYSGALKRTTPNSVPSCQMANQHTPEMQQTFMSPIMQNMCAQPSSVSSVQSNHNSSMEMTAGPSSQGYPTMSATVGAPHSNPSTPLRSTCHGSAAGPSFGSPPQAATMSSTSEMRMRSSTDSESVQAVSSSSSRRSGESNRSKQRTNQQHQQHQQQIPHHMPFANSYMGMSHTQAYPSYPNYPATFDPSSAFPAAAAAANHQYWHSASYHQYAAATKTNQAMGSMMQSTAATAFHYPYPNGVPQNGRTQATWPRYPQGVTSFTNPTTNSTSTFPSGADFMFNPAAGYFSSSYNPFHITK